MKTKQKNYGIFLLRFCIGLFVVLANYQVSGSTFTFIIHNNLTNTLTGVTIRYSSGLNPGNLSPASVATLAPGASTTILETAGNSGNVGQNWYADAGAGAYQSDHFVITTGSSFTHDFYFGTVGPPPPVVWYLGVKIFNDTSVSNHFEVERNYGSIGDIHDFGFIAPHSDTGDYVLHFNDDTDNTLAEQARVSKKGFAAYLGDNAGVYETQDYFGYLDSSSGWTTNAASVPVVEFHYGVFGGDGTNAFGAGQQATPPTNIVNYASHTNETGGATEGTLKTGVELIHADLQQLKETEETGFATNVLAVVAQGQRIESAINSLGSNTVDYSTNISDSISHGLLQQIINNQTNGSAFGEVGQGSSAGQEAGDNMGTNLTALTSGLNAFSPGTAPALYDIDMLIEFPNMMAQALADRGVAKGSPRPRTLHVLGMAVTASGDAATWNIDCNPSHNPVMASFAAGIRAFLVWGLGALLLYSNYQIFEEKVIHIFTVPQTTTVSSAVPLVAESRALISAALITVAIGALPFAFYAWYSSSGSGVLTATPITDLKNSSPAWFTAVAIFDFFLPVENLIAFFVSSMIYRVSVTTIFMGVSSAIKFFV